MMSERISQKELTASESNILRMVVGGMSDNEIAFALDVPEIAVTTDIETICDKIGAADRTSAAALAIDCGLVKIDL